MGRERNIAEAEKLFGPALSAPENFRRRVGERHPQDGQVPVEMDCDRRCAWPECGCGRVCQYARI